MGIAQWIGIRRSESGSAPSIQVGDVHRLYIVTAMERLLAEVSHVAGNGEGCQTRTAPVFATCCLSVIFD